MKTRTKVVTGIIAIILSAVLVFTTIVVINNTKNSSASAVANERTVALKKYEFDEQNLFSEFDEHSLQTDENGFNIVANKNFDTSIY